MLFQLQNKEPTNENPAAAVRRINTVSHRFTGHPNELLSKHIGQIEQGVFYHFWSFGRFAQHDLLFYLLKQIGPSNVDVATWSICTEAIERITRMKNDGRINNIRFVLDPRVKVRNPLPLQILIKNFPYILTPCHAKVTLIYNDDWKISVVTSQNMTKNPRIERGYISTTPDVFEFDKKVFDDIYR